MSDDRGWKETYRWIKEILLVFGKVFGLSTLAWFECGIMAQMLIPNPIGLIVQTLVFVALLIVAAARGGKLILDRGTAVKMAGVLGFILGMIVGPAICYPFDEILDFISMLGI